MCELYSRIASLCKEKNISITEMCRLTGVSRGSLTDLKMGRISSLSVDTLSKIAGFFDVSIEYLLTGEQKEKAPIDFVDEDLRDYLDELRNRPEMRMLFSTTKTATKAQIEAIVKMVEEMQGNK